MSRFLARLAALCCTAILIAVFAHAGEETRPVPSNAQVTRFTRFNIRYKLRDIVAQGVQKVDFYITKDMGATWEYYGEDLDKASPMTVEVPGEGVYGFVCVVTDKNGNREREPRPGTKPETVIVVDRTPPTAKWIAPAQDILGRGSHIELEWEAADEHFGPNPVKIQYATDAANNHDRNAKWFMIQENLPAKGTLTWTPPDSKKYHFRLVAEDRAGNAAIAYCAASVKVDNTPPYIASVKPLRSNKLENNISVEAKDEDGGSGVKEFSLYVSENGSATWTLVKETGVGGESVPVKRRSNDSIAWKAPKSGEFPLWPVVFDEAGNATQLPSVGVAGPYILLIDNEPPNVTLSSSFLMGGSSILSNQSRQVEWTSYDPHPREGTTKILLSVDNGKNWQELDRNLPANGFSTVNFPFGAHGRECKLKVTVEDDFGNVGEAVSETFRLSGAQTTVDSVTPRGRPSSDAAEDIFGSGGGSSPTPPASGGGWFGLGGGASDAGSDIGSSGFGFGGGELPSLPARDSGDTPSLPSLPSRGSDSYPSLPSLPGAGSFPGGSDSFGGSGEDIYGGQSDSYAPQASAGNWRTESAAGPLPSAIVGDSLEPDPDSPEARASSASGLPSGLGGSGLPIPGAGRGGLAAGPGSGEEEWQPSLRGGASSGLAAADESSSYLSGERMPWETASTGSGSLPSGLVGGGPVPPPPGGGASSWQSPAPTDIASSTSDWSGGASGGYSDDMSAWMPGAPSSPTSAAPAPQPRPDDDEPLSGWEGGAPTGLRLPGLGALVGGGDEPAGDSRDVVAQIPEAAPPAPPMGSLRPPAMSTPPATEPAEQVSQATLPPPPAFGQPADGVPATDDSLFLDQGGFGDFSGFPELPGTDSGMDIDQFPTDGMDDFASGIESGGDQFSGDLPGLPGLSGFPGTQPSAGEDGFSSGGDFGMDDFPGDDFAGVDDGGEWISSGDSPAEEDERGQMSSLPWPSRSTELPPEAPQAPAPGLPGLEQAPTSGVFQPPPLETTSPGQRPVNKRQESEHYIRESKAFREEGRPDLALNSATRAVEADPSNPNAYMELSQVNARMAPPDHVRAANLAKEATNLRADWETWWNCADIFYIWAHACNREIQAMSRGGQTPPVHLVDERNSTLSNALIAINNAASVMPRGDRDAAKKVGVTQGMVTYLRALTVPESASPGATSGPAYDEYRRQQAQYKNAVTPLLQEAIPYFKNVLDMGGAPGYQETFQLGIIYFRLAGLERDTGNQEQASTYYQDAVRYLEQATTAGDTPKEGPREAYYMLALSHDQLAEQPGSNRARHKELALRYWRQTADFYDAGSAYRTYAEQRIDTLGAEMGL